MAKDSDAPDDQRGDDARQEHARSSDVPVLPYISPDVARQEAGVRFKTFRKLPAFEANLAAAKLQAAGVECFIADQNLSAVHPLLFAGVRLQVAEADFERAEEILRTPVSLSADDLEDGDAAGDDEYVEETYRCPKCRRKTVDLVPLSGPIRTAQLGCLSILALPLLLGVIAWIVPEIAKAIYPYPSAVLWGWIAAVSVLSFFVLTARRRKRCRECGHEWGGEAS
jgi:hypothetical protein